MNTRECLRLSQLYFIKINLLLSVVRKQEICQDKIGEQPDTFPKIFFTKFYAQ